jgi:hypothetical protein
MVFTHVFCDHVTRELHIRIMTTRETMCDTSEARCGKAREHIAYTAFFCCIQWKRKSV